jgi:hypothetical protein
VSTTQWVAFEPRDTVLVRDGRQFDAGLDATAEPTLPGPSTVAGAVYAAYGGREPEPTAVRGPLFAQQSPVGWTTYLPVPRDVVVPPYGAEVLQRLRPRPAGATVTDLSGDCVQWLVGEGDTLSGWVSGQTLSDYLTGQLFQPYGEALVADRDRVAVRGELEPLLVAEARVGLARDRQRMVRDGMLYQVTHLRAADGAALLVQCVLPDGWDRSPQGPTPLGGRGRLADVHVVKGVDWPPGPQVFPDGRVLVYVATPAIWRTGWKIPLPDDTDLVAAAVDAPQPIATASPRRGMAATRALRWAVPAGSVYLLAFRGKPGQAADRAARWARDVHGKQYGMDHGRAPDDKLITAGFGVVLTGVWS